MKKIIGILLVLFTVNSFAQQKGNNQRNATKTAAEIAEMQTKRLELRMNLTQEQRDAIYQMQMENAQEREQFREERMLARKNREQLTKEERLEVKNKQLDNQLRMQEKMKNILTDEQFKEWKNDVKKQNMKMNRNATKNDMRRNNSSKKMNRKF